MTTAVAKKARGRAKVKPAEKFLLPTQRRWVLDESRLKLMEKGRQLGISMAEAFAIDRRQSLEGVQFDHWVSSRDEIQARLFLQDCKNFAGVLHVGAKDLGEQVIDENGNSAYVLAFANGTRVHSMSSNPDAQAGKRGGRTLDEFALHKDQRKLYSIAYPGITWGGSLSIFSTHRGTGSFFNQLIEEARHKGNPKGFSLHRFTLQNALDEGFLAKLQSKLPADDPRQEMDEAAYFDYIKAGCADSETFNQEYMCIPDDDASAFLSYDLIDSCKYRADEKWEKTLFELQRIDDPLYLGVDVGRIRDLTVFWLNQKVGGVHLTRKLIALQNVAFDEQERIFYELLELPHLQRACVDKTGIGRQFVERAQKRFGEYKVEGVNFSAPVKEELAYPVRAAFEDRSVRIPGDPAVAADLRGIRKETTLAGNIRFTGERSESGHCDRFWALALALHAGKDPGVHAFRSLGFNRRTMNEARINRRVLG